MIPRISLAHLTVIDLAPPEMVHLAAELGYDSVGLRLIRVTDTSPGYPLHQDAGALRATRAALAQTGVAVNDIEFIRLTPDFRVEPLLPLLQAGADLGARHMICAPYDPDLDRLSNNLAALQDRARPYGLSCMLEFFPWTNVPDLKAARKVVDRSGSDDIGILIDTLHFDRSGSTLADLRAVPARRIPFVHLCDAKVHPPYTTEALLQTGRAERLPPGTGEIDLTAILANLPAGTPLALEVPMTALGREKGSSHVAALVLQATRKLLGAHDRG